MHIGITGALGVIGQALCSVLKQRKVAYKGIDILAESTSDEHGDILSYESLYAQLKNCAGIIHLAGISRVADAAANPEKCYELNVKGTHTILKLMASINKPKWLIFASSREVYGQQKKLLVSESSKCNPISIYGCSKLRAEYLIRNVCVQLKIPFAILRFSNVYGSPYDYADRVIPNFFHSALHNESLTCFGKETTCDFVHIQDVVNSIVNTIDYVALGRTISDLNICSGNETSLSDLGRYILNITSSNSKIKIAPLKANFTSRFVGCNQKAKQLLNWCPQITLFDGLTTLYQNILSTHSIHK